MVDGELSFPRAGLMTPEEKFGNLKKNNAPEILVRMEILINISVLITSF